MTRGDDWDDEMETGDDETSTWGDKTATWDNKTKTGDDENVTWLDETAAWDDESTSTWMSTGDDETRAWDHETTTGDDNKELPEGEKYFRLQGFGRTSWCHSVVQALYFCKPFRMELLKYYEEKRKKEGADGKKTLLSALADLFALISSQENQTGVIDTESFMETVRTECGITRDYTQRDAHEFLHFLLAEVAKTVAEDSAATGLEGFQGFTLMSILKCRRCKNVNEETEQPWLTADLDKKFNLLTACFMSLFPKSLLRKQPCLHCNSDQPASKSTVMKKEPRILIIRLKRFKDNGPNDVNKKEVPFWQELQLLCTKEKKDPMYSLTAIIFHLGQTFEHGHFVCVVKSHDRWLLFDQEKAVKMIDYSALNSFFYSDERKCRSSEDVYILFYEPING